MKIIFNRKNTASYGDPADSDNTPQKLVRRRTKMLGTLGRFCGADKIEYIDRGKDETYQITKGHKTLELDISATPFDGGWLGVHVLKK